MLWSQMRKSYIQYAGKPNDKKAKILSKNREILDITAERKLTNRPGCFKECKSTLSAFLFLAANKMIVLNKIKYDVFSSNTNRFSPVNIGKLYPKASYLIHL